MYVPQTPVFDSVRMGDDDAAAVYTNEGEADLVSDGDCEGDGDVDANGDALADSVGGIEIEGDAVKDCNCDCDTEPAGVRDDDGDASPVTEAVTVGERDVAAEIEGLADEGTVCDGDAVA